MPRRNWRPFSGRIWYYAKRLLIASIAYFIVADLGFLAIKFQNEKKAAVATADARGNLLEITEQLSNTLSSMREDVKALARTPEILNAKADPNACTKVLQQAKREIPGFENIAVVGFDLIHICSASTITILGKEEWTDPNTTIIEQANDFELGIVTDGIRAGTKTLPIGSVLYNAEGARNGYVYGT